jgi:hypothetical protein
MPAAAALAQLAVWLAAVSLLAGCEVRDRWTLPSPDFYPAALDYWPRGRVFVVGGYHDGTIRHLSAEGSHVADQPSADRADGRRGAIRLKVDEARDRLWVLDLDALYVYTLRERKLLQRIGLPRATPSKAACLPDMALDAASGTVYVSHNERPEIHRVSAEAAGAGFRATRIALRDAAGQAIEGGISALVLLDKSRALIAGSAAGGKLWRIDPESGAASALSSGAFRGICGLAAHPDENPPPYHQLNSSTLYASMGFGNEVLKITIAPGGKGFRAARLAPSMPVSSPVSLVAFSKYLVVTSSQLARHQDFGGDNDADEPFRLVLMPAGLESMLEIRTSR